MDPQIKALLYRSQVTYSPSPYAVARFHKETGLSLGARVRVVHMRNAVSELGTIVKFKEPDQLDHWRVQVRHDSVPDWLAADPTELSGDNRLWWWVADALKRVSEEDEEWMRREAEAAEDL